MSAPLPLMHVMTRLPVGGVENQLLQVLGAYDRALVAPLVVSLSDTGPIGREIEASGTEVLALGGLGHAFSPSLVAALSGVMRERGTLIVRTHQYHANLYGRLAAWRAGVPCIVASVHNLYTRDRKLHRRLINRALSGMTDAVVAVSHPVRDDILRFDRLPPGKVAVIPNGVDVERFSRVRGDGVRAELGIPHDARVVGTVGRLTPQKDQRTLIEAMAHVGGDAWLLIVGDGPLMGELKERAARAGAADRTVFAGMRRDIPELLAAMDVFALPSLWEGMPNALIEAMAAGRPAVATDIPPFRAVIDSPAVGLIVPTGDARALAAALAALLGDPAVRGAMGLAAGQRARSAHGIETTVGRYMALFGRILGAKGLRVPW